MASKPGSFKPRRQVRPCFTTKMGNCCFTAALLFPVVMPATIPDSALWKLCRSTNPCTRLKQRFSAVRSSRLSQIKAKLEEPFANNKNEQTYYKNWIEHA